MNENFDRAPGAGRTRNLTAEPVVGGIAGDVDRKAPRFNQREPLRQPRTSPPFSDNSPSTATDFSSGDYTRQNNPQQSAGGISASSSRGSNGVDPPTSSSLSASAPEFVPTGFYLYEDPAYDDSENYYGEATLADTVKEFLGHLSSSPGSFDSDIEYITGILNSWVTTEELLKELVDLIFTQSTAIPNFSYTGARLCNYLSHHLNSPSGNFRQMLMTRCHVEFEKRDVAVKGDLETQKKFHSFVLFLGELYLNLEIKSSKGPERARILLTALCDLMKSLFSNPVDANLICAVKLLKLTGSVLDDAWKEKGQSHMEDLMKSIDTIILDASGSRDVRQMLLNLVKLRSSDWGRVHAAAAASNATPDNDPNYFMNEPTFYTEDGTPFTAADPEYAEKYQEILDKEDYFHDVDGENGDDIYDFEDEMEPEIEEAFENFFLESERKRQQKNKSENP